MGGKGRGGEGRGRRGEERGKLRHSPFVKFLDPPLVCLFFIKVGYYSNRFSFLWYREL